MTTAQRVSVLLPCRNAEATLDEALESLRGQTLADFEIIAVNDGSTDRTGEILARWARWDARLRPMDIPPSGIVVALNSAAEIASGEFLARMDADDISDPRRLELQLRLLVGEPALAACGTQVRYFPRSQVRAGARRYEKWINSVVSTDEIERDMFVECPIPHPTLMVRRSAFERVGGYRDDSWPEDYDLILRIWERGLAFGKVPLELLYWRESTGRLSRTDARYDEAAFRRCKAHFLGRRIAGRNVVVCGAGPVGKAIALALKDEGHTVRAFVDLDPRKIGQMVHGAPVCHPEAVSDFRNCYLLAAVGSAKGRNQIRTMLEDAGFREPGEFCAVA